jgi:SAM-dependent methyltransferase
MEIFTNNKNYKSLDTPRFGNLDGGYINDEVFVSYTSFFNEIYGSLLKNFLYKTSKPTIGEIGSGYGEQAYFILKKINAKYIAFDLPEILTLSSFYLMNSFKTKKTLLFGEKEFSKNIINDYELIFMPTYEISKLDDNIFDLMINKHSLGEMPPKVVKNYVSQIKKTSKLFFHINHSYYKRYFEKDNPNLLSHEFGFENDDNFQLLFKYLDFCHFNYDNFQNYNADSFFHIYKKK